MKYCIKEFASLLGLTVDTVRLYEKHDIVSPFKDERNRYRYFDDLDARGLLMSRWYRSLGIPLQEAAGLMKEGSLENAADAVRATRDRLEEEIRRSRLLSERLNAIGNELDGMSERLFRCEVRRMPGVYRLKQTERNRLLQDAELKHSASEWMDLLPFAFYSFRIDPDELRRPGFGGFDHNWGLALTESDYRQAGLDRDSAERVEYFPPAIGLTAVVASPDSVVLHRETLAFMFEMLARSGIRPDGGAFGRLLLTEKMAEGRRSYVEVQIPIAEREARRLIGDNEGMRAII